MVLEIQQLDAVYSTVDHNWLKTLKVGDKVIVETRSSYGSNVDTLTTVTKITPTRQMEVSGFGFKFKDGQARAASGIGAPVYSIVPWSVEKEHGMITERKRQTIAKKLIKTDFMKLTAEQLEQIATIAGV